MKATKRHNIYNITEGRNQKAESGENSYFKKPQSLKDIILIALYLIAGATLAVFLFNQAIEFKYKSDVVRDPCGVCIEYYPPLEHCLNEPIYNTPLIEVIDYNDNLSSDYYIIDSSIN